MNLIKGIGFDYQSFNISSILFLINLFGLSSLIQFISKDLLAATTIEEAIILLNQIDSIHFKDKYNETILFLIDRIEEMNLNLFLSLSNSAVESIFISDQLQIENEDFLLNLILQMIESVSNRKYLLKTVFFSAVSHSLMKEFLK
jgi:hypothetical protein